MVRAERGKAIKKKRGKKNARPTLLLTIREREKGREKGKVHQ
jgi:hypothetical protein